MCPSAVCTNSEFDIFNLLSGQGSSIAVLAIRRDLILTVCEGTIFLWDLCR